MKTVQTFKNMRNEQSAELFFEKVSKKASSFDFIQKPILPRKQRNPNYKTMNDYFHVDGCLEDKTTETYYPTTAKEHYHGLYYEVLDAIISAIQERFGQESFKMFSSIESLLLKCVNLPEEHQELEDCISKFYGDETDHMALRIEANVLRTIIKDKVTCFKEIYQEVKECSKEEQELMPNIINAIKLFLVNPATSCMPERSFLTARRLKTWLRATTKSKRFNSLAISNIHKDLMDKLDLKDIGNEFVSAREGRLEYFGKFV